MTDECVYCDEPLADMEAAVDHHDAEHPRKRYNPAWYWSSLKP